MTAVPQRLSLSKQRRARGTILFLFRWDDGDIYNFCTGGGAFNLRSKDNRSTLIPNYSSNPANYLYMFLIPDSLSLPLSRHLLLLQPFFHKSCSPLHKCCQFVFVHKLVLTEWLTTHSHTVPETNRQQLKVYKIYLLYMVDSRRRHRQ